MSGVGVAILTRGWMLPGWAGRFYPDDLPPEWRLSFFANHFPAVLVPAADWLAAGPNGLAAWAAEVPSRFHFYLEHPDGPGDAVLVAAAVGVLGDALAGVVAPRAPALASPGVPVFVPAAQAAPGLGIWESARFAPAGGLRARRHWLADLAAGSTAGALVILDGEAAQAAELRQWWELAWLSGLA